MKRIFKVVTGKSESELEKKLAEYFNQYKGADIIHVDLSAKKVLLTALVDELPAEEAAE